MLGSSVRMVPAAALRGLAAGAMPAASRSSFICGRRPAGMTTSPRTSKSLGQAGGLEAFGGDVERDGADGADVGGDVFADGAVAARDAARGGRLVAVAGAVLQGEREAVELELADVADGARCEGEGRRGRGASQARRSASL